MRHKTLARTFGMFAVTVVAAGTLAVAPAPAYAAFTSALDGTITRSEVIERAQYWVDHPPGPYSQTTYSYFPPVPDHRYRHDCSGFVDMAWHISGDNNSAAIQSISTVIDRSALQAGDIMDDPGVHVFLFDAWEADHIHFSYYSFGSTPVRKETGVSIFKDPLDGHPNSAYTARRYIRISGSVGSGGNGIAAGDVSGDGRADMIGRKADGTLWLYANSGSDSAPYGSGSQIGTAWSQFGWFVSARVTGDNNADVIAARPDGTLWLYVNSGSPTTPYDQGLQIGISWDQFSNITSADITGDGRADMVAARSDGTLWLYVNGGNDAAPYSAGAQIGTSWQQYSQIVAGDVTGDGRADVVAMRPDGTLWLYVNGGSDTAPYSSGTQIGTSWQQYNRIQLGNVTSDERADVVASRPDGTLWLYVSGGSDTAPYSSGTQIGTGWDIFV